MHQKFSSPIEEIGFARVQFRRTLVFSYSFQRVAPSLISVCERVVPPGLVVRLIQRFFFQRSRRLRQRFPVPN